MQWNREQIMALAPDPASLQAAQGLTNLRKWANLGQNEVALWGECQGSGANPYQTVIELAEPAFKCSCPSRKFPCKHGLALLLLAANDPRPFTAATTPAWAQSWLEGRAKRKESQAQNQAAKPEKVVDSKAQAKRAAEREQKVAQGIADLRLWLGDLVRSGFADLPARPHAFWQQPAARLIDAQAAGLAAQVQALGQIASSGEGWAERLTAALGRLHLLLEAWQRLPTLPDPLQQDVRTLIGWSQSKEEVLAAPAEAGPWCVLSVRNEIVETLIHQRVWLQRVADSRWALILNFAPVATRQSLEIHWRAGTLVEGNLHFYASATPLRALAGSVTQAGTMSSLSHGASIAIALQRYKDQLVHNPWLTRFPLLLDQAVIHCDQPTHERPRWLVYDADLHALPLHPRGKSQPWQILSLTGATPCQLFGEWQEEGFFPLGVWHEGRYQPLSPTEETL